jgi:hypothetical protein
MNAAARETGRMLSRFAFRVTLGLAAVGLYGLVSLVVFGTARGYYAHTYVPLLGAVASAASLFLYPAAMYQGRSVLGLALALTGWCPYLFALFVMVVLGGLRIYRALSDSTFAGLVAGLFWLAAGYFIVSWFWQFTEAVAAANAARKRLLEEVQRG